MKVNRIEKLRSDGYCIIYILVFKIQQYLKPLFLRVCTQVLITTLNFILIACAFTV